MIPLRFFSRLSSLILSPLLSLSLSLSVITLILLFSADGVVGFYRGITSKLVQTVLGAAFMFWAKEKVVVYTMFCIVLLNRMLSK